MKSTTNEVQHLSEAAYIRLPAVLKLIPVCKSTFLAGVRSGRYPKPTRALGQRITAWAVADIRAFLEQAAA